ncbi:MAG: hypothetical protein DRP02_14390, partial [Candidatus Gerdarchaeota archaeon]
MGVGGSIAKRLSKSADTAKRKLSDQEGWFRGGKFVPKQQLSNIARQALSWRQQRQPNVIGSWLVRKTGPVGQALVGYTKGVTGSFLPRQVYTNIPQPTGATQKLAYGAGYFAGFGTGPGKLYGAIESRVAGKIAPRLWQAPKLVRKIVPAVGAEIASSTLTTPIRSLSFKEPLGQAFKSELTGGLAGRAIFGPVGKGVSKFYGGDFYEPGKVDLEIGVGKAKRIIKGLSKADQQNWIAYLSKKNIPYKIRSARFDIKKLPVAGFAGEPPIQPPKPPSSLSDDDLVKQLSEALKKARPLRGVQEKIYSKARAQKLAKMLKAREKLAGEKGFYEELGALKGQLPKVEFESIRQQFSQEAVDRLFNMVKKNKKLGEWEKINAQIGLSKLLGEKGTALPTKKEIEHLYQVFGKEFTDTLLSKRPLIEKLTEAGMQLYNLPRSMMAGVGDLSATLMQNVMFAFRHPVLTAKNFREQLKFFANDKAYKLAIEEIASRPTYDAMKKAKLSLTEVGPFMSKREEKFMSSWAEKIPGIGRLVKASGRAYTGFLNKMRADVFDQIYNSYADMGGNIADERFLKSLGEFINAATGRGSLGKLERAAPVLTQGLFSARKLAATLNLINPAFYIKAHPTIRKEALKTWLSFLGGGMTVLGLAKLAGADVGTDPTSADFGKIKIGNTRLNIFGQYQQIAVLLARLLKGYATSSVTGKRLTLGEGYKPLTRTELIGRFFEMKQHPKLSLIKGALSGQTSLGQPFQLAPELLNRFTPMLLSDAYDLYQEHGPKGLLALMPAALGVSVQTYGRSMPVVETTKTGKKTIKLKFAPGLSETIISKITGKPLTTIPRDQWDEIVKQQRMKSSQKYLREQANRLNKLVDEGKMTSQKAEQEMAKIYNEVVFKPSEGISGIALTPAAISLGIDKYLGEPPTGTIEKAKWETGKFKAAVKVLNADNLDD